jgi:pimeloyl-ACP methyl ester carboxylesterase
MAEIKVVGAGGEYMESVVIVEWLKKPGDAVKAGEVVVIVETAKAATEIDAPEDGILSSITANVGEEVPLGAVLGIIGDGSDNRNEVRQTVEPTASAEAEPTVPEHINHSSPERVVASPLARRVAAQKNIDLKQVKASSGSSRIRLRDVEAFEATQQLVETKPQPVAAAVEKPVRTPTPSSDLDLNVIIRGNPSAEKIVFIHGFGSDGLSWQPLLSAIGGGYQFVLIDLPSHGRSPFAEGGSGVSELTDAVLKSLDRRGIDDFHLVGHSLGGAVSLGVVAQGRLSVRSLTLLAPAGLGPEINSGFISGFAKASHPESLKPWLLKLFANPSFVSPAFISAAMAARADAGLREAQGRLGESTFVDGTQTMGFREVVRDLLIPQKIIWGEQDRIIPMQHAASTGGNAGVHYLPNVGHLPHVEAAAAVARLVLQNVRSAAL